MLAARLAGHLLPRLRDHEPAQRACHQALEEPQSPARRCLERDHARGVLKDAQRHRLVDEADAFRAPRVDRLPGEQHVESGSGADELRQPLHAVPRRHDAKHHFRQCEARFRIVERDTIAAGKRELDAAAHAEAVHHGRGWEGQLRKLLEDIPAQAHEAHRFLG